MINITIMIGIAAIKIFIIIQFSIFIVIIIKVSNIIFITDKICVSFTRILFACGFFALMYSIVMSS